jgi:hypothetical protein
VRSVQSKRDVWIMVTQPTTVMGLFTDCVEEEFCEVRAEERLGVREEPR